MDGSLCGVPSLSETRRCIQRNNLAQIEKNKARELATAVVEAVRYDENLQKHTTYTFLLTTHIAYCNILCMGILSRYFHAVILQAFYGDMHYRVYTCAGANFLHMCNEAYDNPAVKFYAIHARRETFSSRK